jgi:hypothetical protein
MRRLRFPISLAAFVSLMFVPVIAGQRGNSGNHGPSNHSAPVHSGGPSNAGPKSGSPNTNGPGSQGSHGSGNGGATATNSPKHGGTTQTTTSTSTTTTNTTSPTTINFSSTAVGQKLTRNTALQSKLTTRLTALGYTGTVFEAAYGFKNLGQFVAATNVSQNLGIPFDQLKLQMTGLSVDASGNVKKANLNPDGTITLVDPAQATSPAPIKSLGQSIQKLKPSANSTTAASTANGEAETEIENTSKDSKKKS